MKCSSCLVEELRFEIKVEGDENLPIMLDAIKYFNRRNIVMNAEDNVFIIRESEVRDVLDFCKDNMNPEAVLFRIGNQDWRPLSDVVKVLEMQWIDEIIMKESVTSYFQPIVNADGEIYAYEVLARFKREDGSLIYPNEVFTAARNRGRVYALDRLCRMIAVKNAAPLKTKAFINFIPTSIYSPEFCLKSTVQLANQLGIDPSLFVFEVVETEKVDDIEHLKEILAYYKKKGFKYALDDVGEGYSTIEMLADLKPQYMKLDIKYVQGVAVDSKKQHIANRFLEMALQIGSVPLAEGVETREDFEWLKQTGYQLFQGYLFGKPTPMPKR